MGLDRQTPNYIVLEETKRAHLKLKTGKRAVKYEKKIRFEGENIWLKEAWEGITRRKRRGQELPWDVDRRNFFERNGVGALYVEECYDYKVLIEKIQEREIDVQKQQQYNSILATRYNKAYKSSITLTTPQYLTRRDNEIQLLARFRCGNEVKASRFWEEADKKICRMCRKEEETIEHVIYKCERTKMIGVPVEEVLDQSGKGLKYIRRIMEKRKIEEL